MHFGILYNDIVAWQNKTFPDGKSRIKGQFNHLRQEVDELEIDLFLERSNPGKGYIDKARMELADIFFLTTALAEALGEPLPVSVARKFKINKHRTWARPNSFGIIQHDSEGQCVNIAEPSLATLSPQSLHSVTLAFGQKIKTAILTALGI